VNPLTSLYGGVVNTRNALYDRGTFRTRRLRGPVVSIGNLAVGGSGKTPFLIALGELLQQHGVAFDVLSRGYGRASKGVRLVDPDGRPRDFGDEPLLIARRLRVPVVVGEDRYKAGLLAEQRFGPRLHLLDDGFQHRQLARDFDIVLITPTDAQDALLPIGRLREPLISLARADAVVLTNTTPLDGLPVREQRLWRISRGIDPPAVSERCVAFCGIARPDNFFTQLSAAGITLSDTMVFADHHAYTKADIRALQSLRERNGATGFLTTEKDEINLGPLAAELAPLHVVPARLELLDAERAMGALLARIAQRHPRPA
jgi:tetraacyldisaccharide 4'-kinase